MEAEQTRLERILTAYLQLRAEQAKLSQRVEELKQNIVYLTREEPIPAALPLYLPVARPPQPSVVDALPSEERTLVNHLLHYVAILDTRPLHARDRLKITNKGEFSPSQVRNHLAHLLYLLCESIDLANLGPSPEINTNDAATVNILLRLLAPLPVTVFDAIDHTKILLGGGGGQDKLQFFPFLHHPHLQPKKWSLLCHHKVDHSKWYLFISEEILQPARRKIYAVIESHHSARESAIEVKIDGSAYTILYIVAECAKWLRLGFPEGDIMQLLSEWLREPDDGAVALFRAQAERHYRRRHLLAQALDPMGAARPAPSEPGPLERRLYSPVKDPLIEVAAYVWQELTVQLRPDALSLLKKKVTMEELNIKEPDFRKKLTALFYSHDKTPDFSDRDRLSKSIYKLFFEGTATSSALLPTLPLNEGAVLEALRGYRQYIERGEGGERLLLSNKY